MLTKLLDAAATVAAGDATSTRALGAPNRASFQAVANGSSGAFSATVSVQVSNDRTNWEDMLVFSLSGTATTADHAGGTMDAPWGWVRGNVTAITGTNATVTLTMCEAD